jgi:small subunit ribosomal protein S20
VFNFKTIVKGACEVANHKSALKRARQNEVRRLRNKAIKTRVKGIVQEVQEAAGESSDNAAQKLQVAQSIIDKASKRGVIHPRTAARKISRLSKLAGSAKV